MNLTVTLVDPKYLAAASESNTTGGAEVTTYKAYPIMPKGAVSIIMIARRPIRQLIVGSTMTITDATAYGGIVLACFSNVVRPGYSDDIRVGRNT